MASLDTNALSIIEFAELSNDPRIRGVGWALTRHDSVLSHVPWFRKESLKAVGARWEQLPGNNWTSLNEELATVTGAPKQFAEQAYIMRDLIKTDHALITEDDVVGDPHVARIDAYLRGRSYDFNNVFINNSHSSGNAKAIVGLRARLDAPETYLVRSSNKIGSGGTMTAAATSENLLAHLEKLDDLLYAVESPVGDGVVIYCNQDYLKRLNALLRRHAGGGGLSIAQDQFDRSVMKYKGAVLKDIGLNRDQVTPIITSTETAVGVNGSDSHTSLYAVNYGPGQFAGWIKSMLANDAPTEQGFLRTTLIELIAGLWPQTPTCFGRLHGIKLS